MNDEDLRKIQVKLDDLDHSDADLKRVLNFHKHLGYDGTNVLNYYQQLGNIFTSTKNYTLDVNDNTVLVNANSGAVTISLPPAVSSKYRVYNIKKIDSSVNSVTIDGYSTEKIDGATTKSTSTQYVCFTIQSDGISWYII